MAAGGSGSGSAGAQGGNGGRISVGSIASPVVWVVVTLVLAGVLFGVFPWFMGQIGDDVVDEPESDFGGENEIDEDTERKNSMVSTVVGIAPFFAVLLGLGAGIAVGLRWYATPVELGVAAFIGSFLGVIAFLLVGTGIAVQFWETVDNTAYQDPIWFQASGTAATGLAVAIPTSIAAGISAALACFLE